METDNIGFREENRIDQGTRSICYKEGDTVFKVMSGFSREEDATKAIEELKKSRDILVHWLGDYVTPSRIDLLKSARGFSVVTEQPFIEGVSMKKSLEISDRDNLNRDIILDFLRLSLKMYKSTNQVPDVFGRPHFVGWYQVLTTPNVKVELNNGILTPRLLDIGFARLSQNRLTGPLHNILLAKNIENTIAEINNRR